MENMGRVDGKKNFIGDHEKDIPDSSEELFPMCRVKKALRFGEAKALLKADNFDLTILDIK